MAGQGYCYYDSWGLCQLSRDSQDMGAYCNWDCAYVPGAITGCVWDNGYNDCFDYGCSNIGDGYACLKGNGSCACRYVGADSIPGTGGCTYDTYRGECVNNGCSGDCRVTDFGVCQCCDCKAANETDCTKIDIGSGSPCTTNNCSAYGTGYACMTSNEGCRCCSCGASTGSTTSSAPSPTAPAPTPTPTAPAMSPPAGTTQGYCYTDPQGLCGLVPDSQDTSAYCNANCGYVSTPPYGCQWDDLWQGCVDYGCQNAGYQCISSGNGTCTCG